MASLKLKTALEVHAQLTMQAAVHAVREMGWGMRETAEAYGVNRQTLDNRLNGRHTVCASYGSLEERY
ncbi:hypothetical protein RvY_08757 [Ramazzottius varieornatus]|uniref:HTH psq-type domain-containing protein n=1 Tax=Ramazzottius varieornatus TaxID=947166 RepID=A0A1D1V6Z9_RAMVA|nr:hypothetical protein RvY_08757 [Ramazzottius varieornatus]